eukprot:3099678-Amphidinium_carterae.1
MPGDDDAEVVETKKRQNVNIEIFAKQWFLGFANSKKRECGWTMRPNKDTPRQWEEKLVRLAKFGKKTFGRKPILNAAQITVLTDLVHTVGNWVAVGGQAMQAVIAKQLKEWGVPWTPSLSWTRSLLHGIGMNFKRSAGSRADVVPVAEAVDLQNNLLDQMS